MSDSDFKKYECVICGFIYDEAEGLPDDGFPPGTRWGEDTRGLGVSGLRYIQGRFRFVPGVEARP